MKAKSICTFLLIFVCFTMVVQGQKGLAHDSLRIACIGNSITFGARASNPAVDSYPTQLGQLFQEQPVVVRNFGIGGATVLKYGSPSIWQKIESVTSFRPDIAVIMVGTNETVSAPRYNWEHIGAFESDYRAYLTELGALTEAPQIILCSPTDMNLKTPALSKERLDNLRMRRPRLWNLRSRIQQLAREQNLYFLDLTSKFRNKPSLFTSGDGVHPNDEGYQVLAKSIYRKIINELKPSILIE